MNKKTVAVLIGLVVLIGIVSVILYIRSWIEPPSLEISYATVQTALPENVTCAGGSDESTGVAKEILNLKTDHIYVAGGDHQMPDEVWADYNFRLPLMQNSTRNLLFDRSCFFRSPDVPATCEGDTCFTIETMEGYTWLKLTTLVGVECFPEGDGCSGDTVEPGYLSINTIAKCHYMVFEGPIVYELADGQGNRYLMHATETGIPDVENPVLPPGWTLQAVEIDAPLELLPFGGGDDCYYNVVRDNLVQSYHQIAYAGETYPPSE